MFYDVTGAWSAIADEFNTYDELTECDEDLVTEPDAAMAAVIPMEAGSMWDMYDSGVSHHMSLHREDFVTYQDIVPFPLTAANKESFMAHGIGDVIVSVPDGDKMNTIRLTRVLYTPNIGFMLVSIGRINNSGFFSTFSAGRCEICDDEGQLLAVIPKVGAVYKTPHVPPSDGGTANTVVKRMTLQDLHERMGHISPRAMKDLVRSGIIVGVDISDLSQDYECQACILAKSTRKSVPKVREGERALTFGDEIHSDLWGPGKVQTLGGRKYYISFTDD
jgi:hypothetical protein